MGLLEPLAMARQEVYPVRDLPPSADQANACVDKRGMELELPSVKAKRRVSLWRGTRSLSAVQANELFGKKVSQIQCEGLKRIEQDAVLSKVITKTGDTVSAEGVRSDIQALFNMGYFDDIEIQAEEGPSGDLKLTYVLRERPVIAKIEFEGNERFTSSELTELLKLKEWAILDLNKVKEDVAGILKHYEEKGYYLAKVNFEIKPLKEGEVKVVYRIKDFDKIQIKKITFLNNKQFTDDQLKGVLGETREGGFFSFISGSGNFKEAAFKQDLQRLTYWYLDHGYVKFKYENPVITVSDDKKWLFISIYVDEGEQYRLGKVDFSGDLEFSKEALDSELTLRSSDTFSISKRNLDIQRLVDKYQDLGYAFVNVIPKMDIHDDTKTLDVDYSFEKGNLVHFGEINVIGNTKTYENVIRRELKIYEGELYSGTKLRQSKENVERLGYFTPGEVIFNTVSPKGQLDVLNVEISVKERSTGTVTLGAGYGSVQSFFLTAQVSEINLFGRGQALSLAAQYSVGQAMNQSLNLGFTEPYTFDTRWTSGFDLYALKVTFPNKYTTSRLGFDVRFGHPIIEFTNLYLTYKLEGVQILFPQQNVDPQIIKDDSGQISSAIVQIIRDKRNNRFETTEGNYQSGSFETAGLGGDKKYIKWIVNNRFYHKLVGDLVFRNNVEVGQITGYGGEAVPPSAKFYLGGPNNMKGFQLFSLGPGRFVTIDNRQVKQASGGGFEGFTLFELEYPLLREVGIKAVAFFDAGNTWDHLPSGNEPFIIRTDFGFGIRWFSPIGPLRFEWGFPIARRPDEDNSVFQFFIGPPF